MLVLGLVLGASRVPAQTGAPPVQRSAAEDQDYTFCHGLFQDKFYQMAKEQLVAYLGKYPTSIRRQDALFLRAECSYHLGEYSDALAGYESLIREYPKASLTDDGFFRIGQSYLALDRPVDAVRPFKTVLDQFSGSPLAGEASYWLGEAYTAQKDRDNALKYYTLSFEHFPSNPYRDYALYAVGWTHQSVRKFQPALTSYQMLVDSLPSSSLVSAVRIRMAECRFGLEDFASALRGLQAERALITAPYEAGQADYLMAESQERLKNFPAARDAYAVFLSAHPNHPLLDDGTYGLGWSLLQLGRNDSAAAVFGSVVARSGKLAHAAQYRQATAYRLRGDTASALKAFQHTVEIAPEGEFADNALVDRADLLLLRGDTTGARLDAEKVVASFPASDVRADALRIAGESLLRAGDPAAARVRLREAAAVPGARFDVVLAAEFQAAWASFRAGAFAQASEDFGRFVQQFPQHPKAAEARYWQAEAEYRRGSYDRSLEFYRAISSDPGHAKRLDAMYGEGWSLTKLNRFQESAAAFDLLVQAAPRGPLAYDARLRQADALFALKEYGRAGQMYRTVLRTYPDSASNDYAAYQAAQASFRNNDFSEAYRQFADLVGSMPRSTLADDAQYAMGWVNFQRKEYSEAIKEFQKVARDYPTSDAAPRAFYSLGDSYYNLQQYAAAEAAYRELIRRFPESRYVADAMIGVQYCLVAQGMEEEATSAIDQFVRENPGSPADI
ncbi:MAG: tetratricopeptide repeat protein, partial [Bacteroidota bacterium]